jgi:Cu/Ag efflux pump CusA
MYSPLAWVIVGGLLASTFIARIVTPAIYKLIPPAIEARQESTEPVEQLRQAPVALRP